MFITYVFLWTNQTVCFNPLFQCEGKNDFLQVIERLSSQFILGEGSLHVFVCIFMFINFVCITIAYVYNSRFLWIFSSRSIEYESLYIIFIIHYL